MEKTNSTLTGSVCARDGKEVLSERLVAYGPNSKAIAGVGFVGVGALGIIYLLQGLQTPKNPTIRYAVIAMSLSERTSSPVLFPM